MALVIVETIQEQCMKYYFIIIFFFENWMKNVFHEKAGIEQLQTLRALCGVLSFFFLLFSSCVLAWLLNFEQCRNYSICKQKGAKLTRHKRETHKFFFFRLQQFSNVSLSLVNAQRASSSAGSQSILHTPSRAKLREPRKKEKKNKIKAKSNTCTNISCSWNYFLQTYNHFFQVV